MNVHHEHPFNDPVMLWLHLIPTAVLLTVFVIAVLQVLMDFGFNIYDLFINKKDGDV